LRSLLKPSVDLFLRCDVLVNTAGFVPEIQDNLVSDSFIVFVGMDILTKSVYAVGLVNFKKWRAGKADESGFWL